MFDVSWCQPQQRLVQHLWREPNSAERAAAASARLVRVCESLDPVGEVLTVVLDGADPAGPRLGVWAPQRLCGGDLDWVFDPVGVLEAPSPRPVADPVPAEVWDLQCRVQALTEGLREVDRYVMVRAAQHLDLGEVERDAPLAVADDLHGIVQALVADRAELRIHITAHPQPGARGENGARVAARMLLGCSAAGPSARLIAQLRALSPTMQPTPITPTTDPAGPDPVGVDAGQVADLWRGADAGWVRRGLLPDQAVVIGANQVRALVRLPGMPAHPDGIGFAAQLRPAPELPLADALPAGGLRLGDAVGMTGQPVPATIDATDLLRHLQIVGASGTGKSSLLAAVIGSAARHGMGVTVLSPHPDLAERVPGEVDPADAGRCRVIRSGDADYPVPVNPLIGSGQTSTETLLEVFQQLLDPQHEGMFGMRARRVLDVCLRAVQALTGTEGSLYSATLLLQDQALVTDIARRLRPTHPDLAGELSTELGNLAPDNYGELVGWFRSRFQQLLGSATLRAITATGADAVDAAQVMDERQILLIDLASTVIGTSAAQLLGEMWLVKYWDALTRRTDRSPHLLIVDEAHLLGNGLLPRFLAEGRKFGIGVILAHQHLHQLPTPLREAAQANCASLIALRSGPHEAAALTERFGPTPLPDLTRVANMTAIATLSLVQAQTAPFTLRITHNTLCRADTTQTSRITAASREQYWAPHHTLVPLTVADITHATQPHTTPPDRTRGDQTRRHNDTGTRTDSGTGSRSGSPFLDEWLATRRATTPTTISPVGSGAGSAGSAGSPPTAS